MDENPFSQQAQPAQSQPPPQGTANQLEQSMHIDNPALDIQRPRARDLMFDGMLADIANKFENRKRYDLSYRNTFDNPDPPPEQPQLALPDYTSPSDAEQIFQRDGAEDSQPAEGGSNPFNAAALGPQQQVPTGAEAAKPLQQDMTPSMDAQNMGGYSQQVQDQNGSQMREALRRLVRSV